MNFVTNTKSNFLSGKWVEQTCVALVFFNCLSLFADYYWAFDIFANFKLQYLVGGVLLCVLSLVYRYKWYALCMAILAAGLFVEIQYSYTTPFAKAPDAVPNFTVVQYNKFYGNRDYTSIGTWLIGHDFDVVIVNESLYDTVEPLKQFKGDYPFQSPHSPTERFGDLSILSRHPITVTPLPMELGDRHFMASKIIVKKPGLEPVIIYAYHANVPIGDQGAGNRAFQMERFSSLAGKETGRNVLMMGDWNLTPYSPLFKKVLKNSGLNYQNYGLFPQTTWPSFNFFRFLKIPIDHILFNDDVILTDIRQGPSLGSDHHSLVAKFRIDPAE